MPPVDHTASVKRLKPEVATIQPTGITRIAVPHLEDPDVIPLWFGEGDQPTPAFIREAVKAALDAGQTFYANDRGTAATRAALKAYLDRTYGIDVDPERLLVPGSTMLAVTMTVNATLTRGDRALLIGPYWPNIEGAVRMTGADVDHVSQQPDGGRWGLDMDRVLAAIGERTRLVYVNSPCNPSGWVMDAGRQRLLLDVCRERGITLLADEVYHRLVYDGGAVAPSFMTIAGDDDPVVVINGMSKSWAMTGWRLGWMVVPVSALRPFAMMSQCYNTGSTTFAQAGMIAALQDDRGEQAVRELREHYRRNRDLVRDTLGAHPRVELLRPDGAFYAFPRILGIDSSLAFAEDLVRRRKVGLAPGYTFGPGNEQRVRLAFACSRERLTEALERLTGYLDGP